MSIDECFPAHNAVEYKNIHKLKILLPFLEDINKKDKKGNTVLHVACDRHDNEAILNLLLTRDDIDLSVTDNNGFTALHILAYRENFIGLVKIVEKFPSFDIDTRSYKGNTALIQACKMGHVEMVKYLLRKGANVNHKNEKKCLALHYAANNGHTECVQLLLKYDRKNINGKDDYCLTPLMKASKWGYIDTCKVLLKNRANVNAYTRNTTALSNACYNDTVELAEILIDHNANIHFPGPFSSALIVCATRGSLKCAKVLIRAGVDVNKKTRGKTAVCIARENGHQDMVELLTSCGAVE